MDIVAFVDCVLVCDCTSDGLNVFYEGELPRAHPLESESAAKANVWLWRLSWSSRSKADRRRTVRICDAGGAKAGNRAGTAWRVLRSGKGPTISPYRPTGAKQIVAFRPA